MKECGVNVGFGWKSMLPTWEHWHTHPACTFPYAYRSSRRAASNLTLPEVRVFSMKKESPVFLLIYGEGVHGGRGPAAYACGQFAVAGQESVRDWRYIPGVGSCGPEWGRVWLKGISSSAAECQRAFTLGGISPCSASVGESRRAVKLDRKSCSLPWGKSVTLFLGSREAAFESCREFKVGRTAIKRRQ